MSSPASNAGPRFPRVRHGYDPGTVEEYINEVGLIQQSLQQEVDNLRTQLRETSTEASRLRHEAAALADNSPTPQAMTDRIAKMLRVAVDEVSEMQFEARLEAEQMIATAQADAEAAQTKSRQMVAELSARQRAMETEYAELMTKAREEAARITAEAVSEAERSREVEALRRQQAEDELSAELIRMRKETETRLEEQLRLTTQECEVRLVDAKAEAERRLRVASEQIDRRLQDARRSLDEMTEKRISILEQLMQVHGTLEGIPAILEGAYREVNVSPDSGLALSNVLEEAALERGRGDDEKDVVTAEFSEVEVEVEETA